MADLSELDLVMLSLDDGVLSHIATETNRNYHAKFETEPAKHKSAWTDLTVDELKSFIGINIAISLTQIRDRVTTTWSNQHRLTAIPGISEVFPRDRFMQIMRYLHFFDERNAPERTGNYDIYYKVRYFFDVVPKFRDAYQSAREVSIDESMIKLQGRTPGRHFIRNKTIRFSLKVHMLAEAKTGYIINIDLAQADNTVPAGQKITNTAMTICAPYHDLGYHLYMDNWYTSFELCA